MYFVNAEQYRLLPKEGQLSLSQYQHACPVNPIFKPVVNSTAEIVLLYGSYGSGKSIFVTDYLLYESLNNPYFKCLYGRKVFDTLRISVFDTLCDRIEYLGLQHKFTYVQKNASSMRIRGKNGAQFIPFGADNPGKLKSVKDPTHIFCEEFDQFSQMDFGILYSRLRVENAKKQFIGAFNTTSVTKDHWIYKTFIENESKGTSVLKIPCNYTDNAFINQAEYEEKLWMSAGYNERKFKEIAKGEWGVTDKSNVFIWGFRDYEDKEKTPSYCHIASGLKPDYNKPLYLSFDFNVEPITCIVAQHSIALDKVRVLQEYRLMNSDIFELCERIKAEHRGAYFVVTGDASGKSRTAITRGNRNYYQIIQHELMLTPKQIMLPNKNPSIANTRVLCNSILAKHPDYLINDTCLHLIEDIESVTTDGNGGIEKNKDSHKTHLLDGWRYYNWSFLNKFLPPSMYSVDNED